MKIKLNTVNDVKEFVKISEKYKYDSIEVKQGRWIIDGKSIMGVFSLNLTQELDVNIDSESEESEIDFYCSVDKWRI